MIKNKGELLNEIPSVGATAQQNRESFLANNPEIAREARTAQEAEELEWRVRADAARAEIERQGTVQQTNNQPTPSGKKAKRGFFGRLFRGKEAGQSDTL